MQDVATHYEQTGLVVENLFSRAGSNSMQGRQTRLAWRIGSAQEMVSNNIAIPIKTDWYIFQIV